MDVIDALSGLAALSHETRLWVFRLLVQAGADGMSAGEIADALGSRQNTMSSHLTKLNDAGLISGRRDGRNVIYQANPGSMKSLGRFLSVDCCSAGPEL